MMHTSLSAKKGASSRNSRVTKAQISDSKQEQPLYDSRAVAVETIANYNGAIKRNNNNRVLRE